MSELVNNIKVFSLSEVTKSVEKMVSERYRSSFWVKAEMIKLNLYTASGHAYPDLVEKKDGRIVAQLRAIIWKNDFERSNKIFQQVTKEPLKDGITIMFQARITYSSVYGLSLQIIDINPSFSLGELEIERQQTIERLKAEGIFDMNKGLPFPIVPKRLALISVATSKGFSDFNQVIETNPAHYKVFTYLFPSLLQGDNAVETMIEALNSISAVRDSFDAVLIIRGGGGDIGLSCYNNYELCRAIAQFPLPVLTGIGHSTNETVAEMVAFRNAITPTELADFVLGCFENFNDDVVSLQRTLIDFVSDCIQTQRLRIASLQQHLILRAKNKIAKEQDNLNITDKYLTLLNPDNLLSKGYSITTLNGMLIKSVSDIQNGDLIETKLSNGTIKSRVTD
ncbi:MAG: exodeoxyribonuclease VII large subunit [Bacteroidales bacterium]|jgi:exodeoxyribonuclease VII large subunit|nr:exodeoxyribonuclease VII large subunit [Bacteroidales bacterium]